MRTTLTLYTTEGCHLCEQAESLCASQGLTLNKVEISENENLMATYGLRIPVVKDPLSLRELGWPFDSDQLASWLTQLE